MRKPWLEWNRKRFAWTVLPATLFGWALMAGLLRIAGDSPVRFVLHALSTVITLGSLYVTFTYAADYDRKTEPWKKQDERFRERRDRKLN